MNSTALAGEPGARRVSPLLFLLVILTFFLAFAGVSCNTAATRSAIGSIDASEGVSSAQAAQVTACVNALDGVNILTYSGWQLAFGRDPVIGSVPAPCNQGNAAGADTSSANIGPQLLVVLALVSIGLGLLSALAGVIGLLSGRSRALVTAIFGAGAAALLLLDQLHVHDVLLAKISSSQGSSVPGLDAASLFNVTPGTGLLVALVILGLVVLYNVSALVIGTGPAPAATPAPPEPPPLLSPPP
ncbi:MAG: hypothetical protein WB807_04950 [Candidatus Dormiibacterota bacterium]